MRLALGFVFLLSLSGGAFALEPFSAKYSSSYGVLRASGTRVLNAQDDGTWLMEHKARLLLVEVAERSTFMVSDGRVAPQTYQFSNPLSSKRNMQLAFDWNKKIVRDLDTKQSLPLKAEVFDKLSYQVQLKLDVCANPDGFTGADYTVVDRDRLKTYRVTPVKHEVIATEAGPLRTIRLRQVRADKKDDQPTYIWLAPEWQCLLVRLDQEENGKVLSLKLLEANIDGTPVQGER